MFTREEFAGYAEKLQQVGITEENEQREVLDFFYKLAKIIIKKNSEDEE